MSKKKIIVYFVFKIKVWNFKQKQKEKQRKKREEIQYSTVLYVEEQGHYVKRVDVPVSQEQKTHE